MKITLVSGLILAVLATLCAAQTPQPSPVPTVVPSSVPSPLPTPKPFPPRIRGINNNPEYNQTIFLCFQTKAGPDALNVTLELTNLYEVTGYVEASQSFYNVIATSDYACRNPLPSNPGPFPVDISGSTFVSYQGCSTHLMTLDESFTPTNLNTVNQLFIPYQCLGEEQTGLDVTVFSDKGNFETGGSSNSASNIQLDEGTYTFQVTSVPSNILLFNLTEYMVGGQYSTMIVNYDLSVTFEQGFLPPPPPLPSVPPLSPSSLDVNSPSSFDEDGSSPPDDLAWLWWTLTALGIVLVVCIVFGVAGYFVVSRRRRSSYDLVADGPFVIDSKMK